eukprot:m.297783 g.297783  ORF g.297783 m.297783 type:complete len:283 (+) comp40776_c0_seq3:3236-4084(+)
MVKMSMTDAEMIARRDDVKNEWSRREITNHMKELTSGDSLVVALVAENCVKALLDVLGDALPDRRSGYSLRSTYGVSRIQNGFYGSVNYAASVKDVQRFFPGGICLPENSVLESEGIRFPPVSASPPLFSKEASANSNTSKASLSSSSSSDTVQSVILPDNVSSSTGVITVDSSPTRGHRSIATSTAPQESTSTATSTEGLSASGTSTAPDLSSRRFLPVSRSGSLKQVICVLFPPCLVQGAPLPPYTEIIKAFQGVGFVPVALEMKWMTEMKICLQFRTLD